LPRETASKKCYYEYGDATIEMHKDSIKKGQKVLMVDDLLATGGTMKSSVELVEELGGEVAGVIILAELTYLSGREVIGDYNIKSLVMFDK
jgi:adenine phosphoribosyltransferase